MTPIMRLDYTKVGTPREQSFDIPVPNSSAQGDQVKSFGEIVDIQ